MGLAALLKRDNDLAAHMPFQHLIVSLLQRVYRQPLQRFTGGYLKFSCINPLCDFVQNVPLFGDIWRGEHAAGKHEFPM